MHTTFFTCAPTKFFWALSYPNAKALRSQLRQSQTSKCLAQKFYLEIILAITNTYR